MVADDFGRIGRAWPEADYEGTDLETVLQDLLSVQYAIPIRVVAFNTAERWSEDASEDVASEIRRRCDLQMHDAICYPRLCRDPRRAQTTDAPVGLKAKMDLERPIPRGKYLDERLRRFPKDAADNHVRCPDCGGWIDVSDLGAVVDHSGPLPHPAIDQPQ